MPIVFICCRPRDRIQCEKLTSRSKQRGRQAIGTSRQARSRSSLLFFCCARVCEYAREGAQRVCWKTSREGGVEEIAASYLILPTCQVVLAIPPKVALRADCAMEISSSWTQPFILPRNRSRGVVEGFTNEHRTTKQMHMPGTVRPSTPEILNGHRRAIGRCSALPCGSTGIGNVRQRATKLARGCP